MRRIIVLISIFITLTIACNNKMEKAYKSIDYVSNEQSIKKTIRTIANKYEKIFNIKWYEIKSDFEKLNDLDKIGKIFITLSGPNSTMLVLTDKNEYIFGSPWDDVVSEGLYNIGNQEIIFSPPINNKYSKLIIDNSIYFKGYPRLMFKNETLFIFNNTIYPAKNDKIIYNNREYKYIGEGFIVGDLNIEKNNINIYKEPNDLSEIIYSGTISTEGFITIKISDNQWSYITLNIHDDEQEGDSLGETYSGWIKN